MADVEQWFRHIDVDRSGFLDAQEVQRALQMGGLDFDNTTIDAMIRAFDDTNQRRLGLEQFKRLHFFLISCNQSFFAFDRDRSGTLQKNEVDQALRQAGDGFMLDGPALDALMNKNDHDGNRVLTIKEYIKVCLMLQTCSRAFNAFDQQRRGRVDLNFSQFVYACSYLS